MLTKSLPVKLTLDEIRLRGQEVAALIKSADRLEFEKKEAADNFKAQIEACKLYVNKLTTEITEGQVWREVQIEEVKDWTTQQVQTVRMDTGEIVDIRPMTPKELTRPLPFPQPVPMKHEERGFDTVTMVVGEEEHDITHIVTGEARHKKAS